MLTQDILLKKRNGGELSASEIAAFVRGVADETISEGQIAAFTMATWFRGMSRAETVALTLAMRDSGDVLQWPELDRPVADKHSTGGVGDNVSLMLAPIAAACGLAVPMISGRGLGHTGGTLDKLEAIPGYQIRPSSDLFRKIVRNVGCAIIGPTATLAPADKRIYAVRDVTSTVDSVPLITASILSKKLASGLQMLVLDVKIGSGSFMTSLAEAETLARSMVDVANGAGVKTSALITDMNEPLADCAGNALEIAHCLAFLRGEKAGTRMETVVLNFASDMLLASGLESSFEAAAKRAHAALQSGKALELFGRMVSMLGGPVDFVERSDVYLPKANVVLPVKAERNGFLGSCQARDIGMAVIGLGGGRRVPSDGINYAVGIDRLLPLGTAVQAGDVLGFVHAETQDAAELASRSLRDAYTITDEKPESAPVIVKRIS